MVTLQVGPAPAEQLRFKFDGHGTITILGIHSYAGYSKASAAASGNLSLPGTVDVLRALKDPKHFKELDKDRCWTDEKFSAKTHMHYRINMQEEALYKVGEDDWNALSWKDRALIVGGEGPIVAEINYPGNKAMLVLRAVGDPELTLSRIVLVENGSIKVEAPAPLRGNGGSGISML